MQKGDVVMVLLEGSIYHGQTGIVTHVEAGTVDSPGVCEVNLRCGLTCFGEDELKKVSCLETRQDIVPVEKESDV